MDIYASKKVEDELAQKFRNRIEVAFMGRVVVSGISSGNPEYQLFVDEYVDATVPIDQIAIGPEIEDEPVRQPAKVKKVGRVAVPTATDEVMIPVGEEEIGETLFVRPTADKQDFVDFSVEQGKRAHTGSRAWNILARMYKVRNDKIWSGSGNFEGIRYNIFPVTFEYFRPTVNYDECAKGLNLESLRRYVNLIFAAASQRGWRSIVDITGEELTRNNAEFYRDFLRSKIVDAPADLTDIE